MTGHLFEDITRNTTRILEMEALDIPVRLIWGENDPYLNIGVAEDLRSHLASLALHIRLMQRGRAKPLGRST
jgi:haloalkane dehalogenase